MYAPPKAPRSIGGVLDDAMELFAAGFRHCWPVALAYGIAATVLGIYLQINVLGTDPTAATALAVLRSPGTWLGYLVIIAAGVLVNLMMCLSLLPLSRGRTAPSAASQLRAALRLLPAGLVAVLAMVIAVCAGLVLLLLPGLFLLGRWALWTPAYADESGSAFTALGTSWRLTGGNWWRTITVLGVVAIVIGIVLGILGFLTGLVVGITGSDRATTMIASQVVQNLGQVVYVPAIAATMVAVYNDLRLRKDGADLEARLGEVGSASGVNRS